MQFEELMKVKTPRGNPLFLL